MPIAEKEEGAHDPRLLADAPIRLPTEDRYGRSKNAVKLADTIKSIKTDESFVIGLNGEWGSGKTSFINMVCEELRKPRHGEAAASVVLFNPWLIEDKKALLSGFFTALDSALPEQDKLSHGREWRDNLSGLLLEYSSVLTEGSLAAVVSLMPKIAFLGGIPASFMTSCLLTLIKFASKRLVKGLAVPKPSLDDLRSQICAELLKLDENIIVVIDDVDRLSSDEVRLIFKLVTLTASFPRITYLLSFDWGVVTKALTGVQDIDGGQYLEKVVQLDVEMPPLDSEAAVKQINERIAPLFERDHFFQEQRDSERLQAIYRGLILPMLTTPRKVTRYINHVFSKFWATSSEVCLVDILGLSALELGAPEVFEQLWAERDLICKGGQTYLMSDEKKARIDAIKKVVDERLSRNPSASHAVGLLFPDAHLASSAANESLTMEGSRAEGRVYCLDLFSYYRGGVYLPALSWKEADDLVSGVDEHTMVDAFGAA